MNFRRHPAVLVTGGAGFIGTNLIQRLITEGRHVRILDNLSRPGVEKNLRWLQRRYGPRQLDVRVADIRDNEAVENALTGIRQVYHLAAQVAVTTSIEKPLEDFDINVRGTLTLLEAMRRMRQPPSLVYTSTNKVYGDLDDIVLRRAGNRYEPVDEAVRRRGIGEDRPIQFCSPYGCSKGAADQYVLDYARTFDLAAVVFRMSCIYGPHQFGNEDQGWVAHFLFRSLSGAPITIYGDGCQVRDVLFVNDLVQALMLAQEHASAVSGQAFNIGGGPGNTLSLLELLELIGKLSGRRPGTAFKDWRQGDQRFFTADFRRFGRLTGWEPAVPVSKGITTLHHWVKELSAGENLLERRHGGRIVSI